MMMIIMMTTLTKIMIKNDEVEWTLDDDDDPAGGGDTEAEAGCCFQQVFFQQCFLLPLFASFKTWPLFACLTFQSKRSIWKYFVCVLCIIWFLKKCTCTQYIDYFGRFFIIIFIIEAKPSKGFESSCGPSWLLMEIMPRYCPCLLSKLTVKQTNEHKTYKGKQIE